MKMDPSDLPALHALAQEIARELGAPWRYDPVESRNRHGELWHCAALRTGLGEHGVSIRVDWRHNERLAISGRIPAKDRAGHSHFTWYEPQDGKRPEITVAVRRGAKAAAHDILVRLLPIYDPVYSKARGRVDRANLELEELHRVTALFEPYARLSKSSRYNGSSEGRFYLTNQRGTAHFNGYGSRVRMDFAVTPETAVEIMKLVAADAEPPE